MIVVNMVQVLENGKRLVLKISHSLSVASSYAEFFSEQTDVEIKKTKNERDMNLQESIYEITPKSNNAKLIVTIKDDNPTNWSYHFDYLIFRFDGEKWEIEDKLNPNYH